MKNTAKVKYLGVAAAALLAVAPVAAPAVSSVALPGQTSVAKAATTSLSGKISVNPDGSEYATVLSDKDATIFANPELTKGTNEYITKGTPVHPTQLYIENGTVKSLSDKDGDWISYGSLVSANTKPRSFTVSSAVSMFNNDKNTTWTETSNGSTQKPGAGAVLKITSIRLTSAGAINQYTGTSNGKTYTVPASQMSYTAPDAALTEDTDVPVSSGTVNAKNATAQVYKDKATTEVVANTTIKNDSNTQVLALVKDPDGNIVAYKIGDGQYVKASDVNVSNAQVTINILPSGTVVYSDYKAARVYSDASVKNGTNQYLSTKYNAWAAMAVSMDANGKPIAYKLGENQWVKASDLSDTESTGDLKVSDLPANTVMNSNYKAATVYSDATTKKDSGSKLSTDFNQWAAFRVAKDKDGNAVAYDLGDNQWVKASDLDTSSDNSSATTSTLPAGTAVFSNYKAAKVYSEPEGKNATGKLATSVNEWAAFRVAKDDNGNVIAYDLGSNQWVKAADLDTVEAKNGTFYANAGTPLYDRNGGQAGSISATGAYKVFALTYINGKQALKLGSDSQWIMAAAGAYYPA
ncbi:hypothetical protein ACNAN0_01350 [Agrilactobacillus fermenti]|uniref:hypothetical protein n=1 Tax=Agrilactobacillus fermenti TaxID=2586909 RepID=UPI003A5C6ABC